MTLRGNKFSRDVFLAMIIATIPFLIYVHLLFENTTNNIVFMGFSLGHRYATEDQLIWSICLKFIPVLLFGIWFITNLNWWRLVILIPTIVFLDSLIRHTLLHGPLASNSITISILVNSGYVFILLLLTKLYRKKLGVESTFKSFTGILISESKSSFQLTNDILQKLRTTRTNNTNYLQNLFLINSHIETRQHRLKNYFKKREFDKRFICSIILILIVVPFSINLHLLIPAGLKSLDFGVFSIQNYGFPSVDILVWLFLLKANFLCALSIWFITCQYWWRYAILSPVILVSYQIWEMFQGVRHIDAWGNLQALPFILGVIITLLFLSSYVKYEYKFSELHQKISEEMDEIIDKNPGILKIRQYRDRLASLNSVSAGNVEGGDAQRLNSLLKIREELINDLDVNY